MDTNVFYKHVSRNYFPIIINEKYEVFTYSDPGSGYATTAYVFGDFKNLIGIYRVLSGGKLEEYKEPITLDGGFSIDLNEGEYLKLNERKTLEDFQCQ